jgi:thiamine-phosphate pyrophosphorylase
MVITDRELAGERGWLAVTEAALEAGATAVQLRDKRATSRELLEMAVALRPFATQYGALFLVNDRFDVALAAEAHGVHLGDDDIPVAEVRRVVPRDFIIGRSADTEEAARAAEAQGADYLGVGSVFGTRTKKEVIGEVIGTEQLGRVARAVSIPVVGIGGVSATNAAAVAAAGAAGLAVVSAVMAAPAPGAATRSLLDSWSRG